MIVEERDQKWNDNGYVIWNGFDLVPYRARGYHDYMIPYDAIGYTDSEMREKVPSVQSIRAMFIKSGRKPVVVLACSRFQCAHEVQIGEEWRGLFTYTWLAVLREAPKICLRELITVVNQRMGEHNKEQVAETVCTREALTCRYRQLLEWPFALLTFDMCRMPRSAEMGARGLVRE